MVNAIVAERSPRTVRAVADCGHEVLSHSYATWTRSALGRRDAEDVARCTFLHRSGPENQCAVGSPRARDPSAPKLLAEAGYRLVWRRVRLRSSATWSAMATARKLSAIPLAYDVNDMPSMKYGHPPRMMLKVYNEVIEIARAGSELRIIDVTSHAHIFGHHRGAYFTRRSSMQAMSSPDIVGCHPREIADHVLSIMPGLTERSRRNSNPGMEILA